MEFLQCRSAARKRRLDSLSIDYLAVKIPLLLIPLPILNFVRLLKNHRNAA
jgi:hypothetical protein